MGKEVKLPDFKANKTLEPMHSPLWIEARHKWRRQQFSADFLLASFFAMVFAIVVHMVAGR